MDQKNFVGYRVCVFVCVCVFPVMKVDVKTCSSKYNLGLSHPSMIDNFSDS